MNQIKLTYLCIITSIKTKLFYMKTFTYTFIMLLSIFIYIPQKTILIENIYIKLNYALIQYTWKQIRYLKT